MESSTTKINCSVGVLTYNSEKNLRRCLESIQSFKEIVVTDGGSTDNTLAIAREFGAKIINQSNPGAPIIDFSKERNLSLEASTLDWFFYLDSDEVMSDELKEEISKVTSNPNPEFLVYEVKYKKVSPDLKIWYRTFKDAYQTRLFNKKTGARFIKPIHERIEFDKNKFKVGRIESPWLVVLDDNLIFSIYKKKARFRLDKMASERRLNPRSYLRVIYRNVLLEVVKSLAKIFYLYVLTPRKDNIPLKYELYRLYSSYYIFVAYSRKFLNLR